MKIAIVNTHSAKDITFWSGIPFHIGLLMERIFGNEVKFVKIPALKRGLRSYLLGFYYNKILKKKYYTWADEKFIQANKKNVENFLNEEFDLIITFQFYLVPLLKKINNKVINWNDATFQNLHNYYTGYSNFSNYSIKAAHAIQKQSLDLSDITIYSSDWAIKSAVSYYKTDITKLKKIPFASNFKTSLLEKDLDEFIKVRNTGIVKLLFLTADWERKGGHDAVEVLNLLNEKGIRTFLYVVGSDVPLAYKENKNIVHCDFINKNSLEGENKLINLFKECTYLIMPTRVDITPVTFCEANSFALPVITTKVGPIPSIIQDNVNGFCIEVSEFAINATDFIQNNLPTNSNYNKLCRSSFLYNKANMSWEQVENKFRNILKEIDLPI